MLWLKWLLQNFRCYLRLAPKVKPLKGCEGSLLTIKVFVKEAPEWVGLAYLFCNALWCIAMVPPLKQKKLLSQPLNPVGPWSWTF